MDPIDLRKPLQTARRLPLMTIAAFLLLMTNKTAAAGAALNWQTAPGYRWSELPVPSTGKTGFTLLSPQSTGILFTNYLSPERYLTNSMLLNGSGRPARYVDGDGLCGL